MAAVKKKTKRRTPRPDYDEAVRSLAREHARVDRSIREIWSFDDPAGKVVRVIEVYGDHLLPPENGVVQAVRFGRSSTSPFPLEIALLSLADWKRLEKGALLLPSGWGDAPPRKVKG